MEIYLFGEWGTITHDSTNNIDAQVVCRQLGYDTRCKYCQYNTNVCQILVILCVYVFLLQ